METDENTRLPRDLACTADRQDVSGFATHWQVRRLIARYRISEALAVVVSELAYWRGGSA
jgi:hypothetical protein